MDKGTRKHTRRPRAIITIKIIISALRHNSPSTRRAVVYMMCVRSMFTSIYDTHILHIFIYINGIYRNKKRAKATHRVREEHVSSSFDHRATHTHTHTNVRYLYTHNKISAYVCGVPDGRDRHPLNTAQHKLLSYNIHM